MKGLLFSDQMLRHRSLRTCRTLVWSTHHRLSTKLALGKSVHFHPTSVLEL